MRISDWSSDVCSSDLHALVAVDIGQLRFTTRGRGEAGVIGEGAGLAIEFADVDDVGADAARQDGALYALAPDRTSVVSGERVSVRVDLGGRSRIKETRHTFAITI